MGSKESVVVVPPRKHPWLAALFGLLFPGLGFAYVGHWWGAAVTAGLMAGVVQLGRRASGSGDQLLLGTLLVIWIGAALFAATVASRMNAARQHLQELYGGAVVPSAGPSIRRGRQVALALAIVWMIVNVAVAAPKVWQRTHPLAFGELCGALVQRIGTEAYFVHCTTEMTTLDSGKRLGMITLYYPATLDPERFPRQVAADLGRVLREMAVLDFDHPRLMSIRFAVGEVVYSYGLSRAQMGDAVPVGFVNLSEPMIRPCFYKQEPEALGGCVMLHAVFLK